MIPGFTKDTWNGFNYDDSSWETACEEEQPPKGVFRECLCEPIRICEEYEPKEITKIGEQKYLFDFGQNMSGFARLNVNQPSGDKIVLEYAESMNADHTIQYHGMNEERLYADRVFQTDDFICCGKPFSWTPLFTYHGFRYVVVSGLKDADQATLTALFVHQDVKRRTEFECSEQSLNKLFEIPYRVYLHTGDERCTIHRQTAVAMLIYYDIYETLAPLAAQLKQLVEEKNFHHDCGMVGIRRLYAALSKCGLEEYAYKIITAKGYPSYVDWIEGGQLPFASVGI